eukprot:SAG22_NODE_1310_length_4782_cov_2.364723_2_plen_479_part_00
MPGPDDAAGDAAERAQEEQDLRQYRTKLGRNKKKKNGNKIISTGLHGSQTSRTARPHPPSHSRSAPVDAAEADEAPDEKKRRQSTRRRVDMGALRAAVAEEDKEIAGMELERMAMSDPAASTFANIDDVCVKMLLNGQQGQALDYLSRLGEMIGQICTQLDLKLNGPKAGGDDGVLPAITPQPPAEGRGASQRKGGAQTARDAAGRHRSHHRRPDGDGGVQARTLPAVDGAGNGAGGGGGGNQEVGLQSSPLPEVAREPTLAERHEREWAERKQRLDAELIKKLKDELKESTAQLKAAADKSERLGKELGKAKARADENDKRLKLSMRHVEDQLRTLSELNAVQQGELAALRARTRETDAVVGLNMPAGGLLAGGDDADVAEEWEEKILELAEAEYTISQLKEKRKADAKKIKLLSAKLSSYEEERSGTQGVFEKAADLASRLKQAKVTTAQKAKALQLAKEQIGRLNQELAELRQVR